jgi:hypothetical protein
LPADAPAAIDKLVHLEGTGANAKLGAVVVKGDLSFNRWSARAHRGRLASAR